MASGIDTPPKIAVRVSGRLGFVSERESECPFNRRQVGGAFRMEFFLLMTTRNRPNILGPWLRLEHLLRLGIISGAGPRLQSRFVDGNLEGVILVRTITDSALKRKDIESLKVFTNVFASVGRITP
jgi:hypothetical protein